MEKEHVDESAIQVKCDDEDWDYDNICTFSRVTFGLPVDEDHWDSEKDCNKRQMR